MKEDFETNEERILQKRKELRRERRRKKRIQRLMLGGGVFLILFVILGVAITMISKNLKKEKRDSEQEISTVVTEQNYTVSTESDDNALKPEGSENIENAEISDTEEETEVGWVSGYDVSPDLAQSSLIVDTDPTVYTYDDMVMDKDVLLARYPDLLKVKDMGTTLDQREIWLFRIGSEDAENKVLIHAGIHAREYIVCQLSMKQIADFLAMCQSGLDYKGYSLDELLEHTAVYVIPMVNPDGTCISQSGLAGIQTEQARLRLEEIAQADGRSLSDYDYTTFWKANANGTDLNRNFDAMWDTYLGAGHISSDHYKGTMIGSEVESKILIDITNQYMFDRTISYHTHGSVVYWYFQQPEPLYSATYRFAQRMGATTGYWLDANYQNLDPAGYKDWCVYKMDIPSVTIEVGTQISPVPVDQFQKIWNENQYVIQETLIDVLENPYKPSIGGQTSMADQVGYNPSMGAVDELIFPEEGSILTVVKCKEWVSLRATADTSAEALTTIPLGDQVTYIEPDDNGFYKVVYHGQTGFVLAEYLQ